MEDTTIAKDPGEPHRGSVSFVLATICSLPFVLTSCLILIDTVTKKQFLPEVMGLALFSFPFLLLVALAACIFIIAAWRKRTILHKLVLMVYALAIALYWIYLYDSGPW